LVVLRNNKLYVDTNISTSGEGATPGHPFAGYYLPYPARQTRWKAEGLKGKGFISTIMDDAPMLNWVYVD
jgi:hypothetical protein